MSTTVDTWATEEFSGAIFGDKRLTRRASTIATAFAAKSEASIPDTFEKWSATRACYRFFASEKVTPERILMPHQQRTVDRMREHSTVLVVQDITELNFTRRRSTTGLGPLRAPSSKGLLVQTALALTPDGVPLGVLEQDTWVRASAPKSKRTSTQKASSIQSRSIEQKQTQHWLDVQASVCRQCADIDSTVVSIGDREADFYDFFARPRPENTHVLVRVRHNRRLAEEQSGMLEALAQQPLLGELSVEVARNGGRDTRTARVAIRAMRTRLAAPKRRKSAESADEVEVSLVEVTEIDPPSRKEAIHWVLLTTLSLESFAEAVVIVEYYSRRWQIERFHYTLKSGCAIEALQLESRDGIENALSLYSVVSWRLAALLYQSRVTPQSDASEYFSVEELKMLMMIATRQQPRRNYMTNTPREQHPVEHLTLKEAVLVIARMGGFLARTGDGDPGLKTLWRGMRKLDAMIEALRLLDSPDPLMGNG